MKRTGQGMDCLKGLTKGKLGFYLGIEGQGMEKAAQALFRHAKGSPANRLPPGKSIEDIIEQSKVRTTIIRGSKRVIEKALAPAGRGKWSAMEKTAEETREQVSRALLVEVPDAAGEIDYRLFEDQTAQQPKPVKPAPFPEEEPTNNHKEGDCMYSPDVRQILTDPMLGGGRAFTIIRGAMERKMGRLQPKETLTIEAHGNIQPAGAADIQQLPEEDRYQEVVIFRTTTPFQLGGEEDETIWEKDIIAYEGNRYRILRVDTWPGYGLHFAYGTRINGEG